MVPRPSRPTDNEQRQALLERLRKFRDARGWQRFHAPDQLAAALSVEAAEVLEHFLWVSDSDADAVAANKRDQLAEELADVFIYLLYLADRVGVDLWQAAELKIDRNEGRFPVDSADKWR